RTGIATRPKAIVPDLIDVIELLPSRQTALDRTPQDAPGTTLGPSPSARPSLGAPFGMRRGVERLGDRSPGARSRSRDGSRAVSARRSVARGRRDGVRG